MAIFVLFSYGKALELHIHVMKVVLSEGKSSERFYVWWRVR